MPMTRRSRRCCGCASLESLIVRVPVHENSGLGLKQVPPKERTQVTVAVWQHLPSFTKLRRLELSGTLLAGRATPQQLAGLERLPLLSTRWRCATSTPTPS